MNTRILKTVIIAAGLLAPSRVLCYDVNDPLERLIRQQYTLNTPPSAVAKSASQDKITTTGGTLLQTFDDPSPVVGDDRLGRIVARAPDGNLLIGAPGKQVGAIHPGAAYIFNNATGSVQTTFSNPNPHDADGFGGFAWSTPTRIVIGAPSHSGNGTNSGAAYVFNTAGQLQWTLQKPSPLPEDWFGYSVNAAGETALVGCRLDDAAGYKTGSVYAFNALTGQLIRRFDRPTTTSYGDNFGLSIAGVGTNRVLIGAPGVDDNGTTDTGAAYVFDISTGNLVYTLHEPHAQQSAFMGILVRASGDDFLVGTFGGGRAYLFSGATGQLIYEIPDPEPATSGTTNENFLANQYFSIGLASAGDYLMISGPKTEPYAKFKGAVYVYRKSTGALLYKILSPLDQFNFGISIDAWPTGEAVMGENYSTVSSQVNAGRGYLFRIFTPAAVTNEWLAMP